MELPSFLSPRKKRTSSHIGAMGDDTPTVTDTRNKDEGERLQEELQLHGKPSSAEASNGGEKEENADADEQRILGIVRHIVQEEVVGFKELISDNLSKMERRLYNYIAGQESEQQLDKKITQLAMELAQSLEVQHKLLQEEARMLKPQHSLPNSGSFEEGAPTLPLLEEALHAMQRALSTCTVKMTEQLTECHGNRRHQLQIMLYNQLLHCLFSDFESSSFGQDAQSVPVFQRPNQELKRRLYEEFVNYKPESAAKLYAAPQTLFRDFYISRRNLLAQHRPVEPFANQQKRQSVLAQLFQNEWSPLFADFALLAKTVWLLHKLAFAFEPTAQMFRVDEGTHFDADYMEIGDGGRVTSAPAEVAFMASPGFTFRNCVLKARVHLKRGNALM